MPDICQTPAHQAGVLDVRGIDGNTYIPEFVLIIASCIHIIILLNYGYKTTLNDKQAPIYIV